MMKLQITSFNILFKVRPMIFFGDVLAAIVLNETWCRQCCLLKYIVKRQLQSTVLYSSPLCHVPRLSPWMSPDNFETWSVNIKHETWNKYMCIIMSPDNFETWSVNIKHETWNKYMCIIMSPDNFETWSVNMKHETWNKYVHYYVSGQFWNLFSEHQTWNMK